MRTEDDLMTEDVADALAASGERMTDAARADVRRRVIHTIRSDSRAHFFASHARRVAAACAAVCVLSGGVAYAAGEANPGDPLYGVKRASEDALIALLPPGALEHGALVGIAGRRAGEAANLASEGATTDVINDTLADLRRAVAHAAASGNGLANEEMQRIQEQASDAPARTREAVSDAVAPATGGSGGGDPAEGGQGPQDSEPSGSGVPSGSGGQPGGTTPGNPENAPGETGGQSGH